VATLAQARLSASFAAPWPGAPRDVVGAAMLARVAEIKETFTSAASLAQLLPALQPPPSLPSVAVVTSPFKRKQPPVNGDTDAADGAKRRQADEGLQVHSRQLSTQVPSISFPYHAHAHLYTL
jgi:hypothetical protein